MPCRNGKRPACSKNERARLLHHIQRHSFHLCGLEVGEVLNNSEAVLSGIIDVFAILAAVLVAVISIIGDPSMLMPGNWRVGHEHAKDIQKRISRFSHLFTVYIAILLLVIIAQIVDKADIEPMYYVFNALAGLTVFGFLLSVPLPYSLMSIQRERMDEEIKRRQGDRTKAD